MIAGKIHVNIFDLIASLARIVDLMCPAVGNHHMQVAYLAYRIGEEIGLPEAEKYDLVVAGALHDIGAFSLKDRLDLLEFEDSRPGEHSQAGYVLLKNFKPFFKISEIIKFHHLPWDDGKGAVWGSESVPRASHIIHIADRVAVKISKETAALAQVQHICDTVFRNKNSVFVPEYADAILALSKKDYIWLELTSDNIEGILRKNFSQHTKMLDTEEVRELCLLICRIIDFKSEFTATHSSGVAATAVALSRLVGFSEHESRLVEIAAYLHDLGKLAIPSEIIEKQEKLTEDEWSIMRSHVYYTYQVLESVKMFGLVNYWGSLHQERLNGSGYPFGLVGEALPLGAKIMATADVFTALTEDRPYRKRMRSQRAQETLLLMADREELDKNLVELVLEHFSEMDTIRESAQKNATVEYQKFQSLLQA